MNPERDEGQTDQVLALVRDLMFASKITATARAEGVAVQVLRDPAALVAEAGTTLIVDLNQPGVLAAAVEWRKQAGRRVIGFVSHVDAETIRAAREGGFDRVMARSEFVRVLPELLRHPTRNAGARRQD